MPAKPEARDVRGGLELHGPKHLGGMGVQMGGPAVEIRFGLVPVLPLRLDGGRQNARTERLGQHQYVARPQPGVARHGVRVHIAGHGQAVLDFRVLQRVASGQHRPGFRDLFKPALQHRREDVQGDFLRRKCRDVHGRPRHAADRVYVRKRVRRRNLPEQPRIVAERAQDVHRLHQRHARRRRTENHRILVVLESVQYASLRVGGTRQGRQNLLQQLWSRLRRSAGGLGFVHQSERHDMLLGQSVHML